MLRAQPNGRQPTGRETSDIVSQAWSELVSALQTQIGEPSAELEAALIRLKTIDEHLLNRIDHTSSRLTPVIAQLEALPCVVSTIAAATPRLVCDLGFDRAVISTVADGVWSAEHAYIPDEPAWSAEVDRIGRENPQQLDSGLHEAEIVRRQVGLVVTEAQEDPRVNRPIVDATGCDSYVAAPIMARGRVRGFIHADRFRSDADLSDEDCRLLSAFTQTLGLALGRARLDEHVTALRTGSVTTVDDALDEPDAGRPTHRSPAVGRRPDEMAELTARERQVLGLIAQGLTNDGIARTLVISVGTVKHHVKQILRKLQAQNRSQAAAIWHRAQ